MTIRFFAAGESERRKLTDLLDGRSDDAFADATCATVDGVTRFRYNEAVTVRLDHCELLAGPAPLGDAEQGALRAIDTVEERVAYLHAPPERTTDDRGRAPWWRLWR